MPDVKIQIPDGPIADEYYAEVLYDIAEHTEDLHNAVEKGRPPAEIRTCFERVGRSMHQIEELEASTDITLDAAVLRRRLGRMIEIELRDPVVNQEDLTRAQCKLEAGKWAAERLRELLDREPVTA